MSRADRVVSIVDEIRNPPEGHAVTMTESARQAVLFWKGLAEKAADELEAGALKDHEIAQLVNELAQLAKAYVGTEQLREHISRCVVKTLNQTP